jgi:hypothetical protein
MDSCPLVRLRLFIGGRKDGLTIPAPDDAETVELPLATAGKEFYVRDTLMAGDVFITSYRHESLTPEEVLNLNVYRPLVPSVFHCGINSPGAVLHWFAEKPNSRNVVRIVMD